jgi:hypothetical protein
MLSGGPRQHLRTGDGLLATVAVGEHAGQGRHLGDPASVRFLLDLDLEHDRLRCGSGHRGS